MSLLKIEGFDKSSNPQIIIAGINLPYDSVKQFNNKITVSAFDWGSNSNESIALAIGILMTVTPSNHWGFVTRSLGVFFCKKFVSGWGDGNFSVEIDMKQWLKNRGYEYMYRPPHSLKSA